MKRSEIKRSAPMGRGKPMAQTGMAAKKPLAERKVRTRKCVIADCRKPFAPRSMTHKACGPECAERHTNEEKARKDKRERQQGLAKLKRKADYIAEAQKEFNTFIRLRDQLAGHPCISSGRPLDWSGNNVDAGHYRSRGSAPHLRFDERNVHAQSKQENRWASGNATDYRIGLINRIGLAEVEALEADNTERRYTIDELKAIKAYYKAKTKALLAQKETQQFF